MSAGNDATGTGDAAGAGIVGLGGGSVTASRVLPGTLADTPSDAPPAPTGRIALGTAADGLMPKTGGTDRPDARTHDEGGSVLPEGLLARADAANADGETPRLSGGSEDGAAAVDRTASNDGPLAAIEAATRQGPHDPSSANGSIENTTSAPSGVLATTIGVGSGTQKATAPTESAETPSAVIAVPVDGGILDRRQEAISEGTDKGPVKPVATVQVAATRGATTSTTERAAEKPTSTPQVTGPVSPASSDNAATTSADRQPGQHANQTRVRPVQAHTDPSAPDGTRARTGEDTPTSPYGSRASSSGTSAESRSSGKQDGAVAGTNGNGAVAHGRTGFARATTASRYAEQVKHGADSDPTSATTAPEATGGTTARQTTRELASTTLPGRSSTDAHRAGAMAPQQDSAPAVDDHAAATSAASAPTRTDTAAASAGAERVHASVRGDTSMAASWAERVVESVRVATLRGGGEMRLRLEPAGLGNIDVRISLGHDGVHAAIVAEHDTTRVLLRNEQYLLHAALERSDMRLAGFTVDLGFGSPANGFAEAEPQLGWSGEAHPEATADATNITTIDTPVEAGRLNVRV